MNPKYSEAYNNKGWICIYYLGVSLKNLKRHEEAIQMYNKAIKLNPQYSEAYKNKGLIYIYVI